MLNLDRFWCFQYLHVEEARIDAHDPADNDGNDDAHGHAHRQRHDQGDFEIHIHYFVDGQEDYVVYDLQVQVNDAHRLLAGDVRHVRNLLDPRLRV